jgi:ParB-like nuclease family protein
MLRIQKTSDYSLFRKYDSTNRKTYDGAVKALVISIQQKNMLESHPILIDKDMYVIDGQHRLAAAEKLNVPIYYVIDENVEEQDIPRCQIQKKWECNDYLKYYAVVKDDYAFVKDIFENYEFSSHLPFVIRCCGSISSATDAFRKGTYKITKDKQKLREKFHHIREIKKKITSFRPHTYFSSDSLKAFWKIVSYPNYNHELMMAKIEKYIDNVMFCLNFKKKDTIHDSFLEKVYDYNNKKIKKLNEE